MFLKSISLAGFKSFGGRANLELDPGITVIVGPNGSGKSNIVDAVAWVTGGQSTRTLRADRSDDLLFCGTATLAAASRAEVTLVFDNSSGLLPIDRPEVSITRRYYRSGESEFEINREPCRLMDITELLAAAGMRKSRYVLLGQGQVDQILNASASEHRKVLEEAAGVGKHLWRRDRAVSRLESTRSDLDRIGDLIAEKGRRLRPLRRQSEALGRYSRLVEEIRRLRLFLEGQKLREIDERLMAAVDSRSKWMETRSEAMAEQQRGMNALAGVEIAQEELRSDPGGAVLRDWKMVTERMRRLSQVATLRSQALKRRRHTESRRLALVEERAGLEKSLSELHESQRAAGHSVEECRISGVRLAREERRLASLQGMAGEAQIAGLQSERAALEAAGDRDRRELEALEARLAELSCAAELLDSEAAVIERKLVEEQTSQRAEEEEVGKARRRVAEERMRLRDAEAGAVEARTGMAEAVGRLEVAREALRGVDPNRRRQVEGLAGWVGWVAQVLDVPSELAAAVEAGLGKWAEAAVFEGPVAVGNAVDRLGATAAVEGPVSMVSTRFPGGADSLARTVAISGSKVTPLVDHLDGSHQSPLALRLLGDVVLVEDWQSGFEVVVSHPRLRAVTRRGDLITVRGVALGGGERLPDLAAATSGAEAAVAECQAREQQVQRLRRQVESVEESLEKVSARFELRRLTLLKLQRDWDRAGARRREIGREEDRLNRRRSSLVEESAQREVRMTELGERIGRLRRGRADSAVEAERLSRQLEEVSGARAAADEEYRRRTSEVTRLGERRRLERARFEQVVVELAEVSLLPEDLSGDLSEEVAEVAAVALRVMSARREALVELDRTSKRRARDLASAAAAIKASMQVAADSGRRATTELEKLIAEVSRLEAVRHSTVEGLLEMNADPEEALGVSAPGIDDPAGTLEALAAELERMRPINHYAASDLAQVEAELSELSDQYDDIVDSGRQLRKVISELEKEATERYLATFRETATAFEQTFGQVFPGGRGRLTIVDPADPLGSGVEIHARPLGKRVSRLSLLSGGERALGALAFLFAMMRTRPSPFYLLDEMDATLDSANLHRVLEMVKELRSRAQILIITHQPQTAEIAEVLYGVTMPPGGATQVVSHRIDRTEAASNVLARWVRSA